MAIDAKFRRLFFAAAIAAALIAGGKFWLFREMVAESSDGSRGMVFRWRWGWAYEAAADLNQDGRDDQLLRMEKGARDFTCHYGLEEILLDADFDCKFELRLSPYPENRVQIDDDGDAIFDRTLEGEAARAYRAEACGRMDAR